MLVAVTAFVLWWPLAHGSFGLQIGSIVAIYAFGVIGIDLIVGRAGMLQLGYGLFFGAGAYTVGLLAVHTDIPTGMSIVAGAVVAGVVAAIVGWVVVGVSGYLFALVTLASVVAVESFVRGTASLGGSRGLAGIGRDVVGLGPVGDRLLYVCLVMFLFISILLYARLRGSRAGRALEALRLTPHVAEASGVRLKQLRFRVWIASGTIGGLAGALFALTVQFVSPEILGVGASINFLVMNVVGGVGIAWAGVPGAILVRGLVQAVQALQDFQLIISGVATVAVIVWFRRGIAGSLTRFWNRLGAEQAAVVAGREERANAAGGQGPSGENDAGARAQRALAIEANEARELSVDELSVRFGGVRALQEVSLSLQPGSVTGLVGPNGSGKTTFVNAVSGRVLPDGGQVRLGDVDLTMTSIDDRVRLGVTRTFQLVSLCETLSALENVMIGGHLLGSAGIVRACVPRMHDDEEAMIRARALSTMEALGIRDLADEDAADLPAGPRRLVEIARCLMSRSEVVLLDEPASGLNPSECAHLSAVIRELARSGRAVLLIEHDFRFVLELADRVAVLDEGVKIAEGTPDEIAADERVIEAYIGG